MNSSISLFVTIDIVANLVYTESTFQGEANDLAGKAYPGYLAVGSVDATRPWRKLQATLRGA